MTTHVVLETEECPVCAEVLEQIRALEVERRRPTPPKPPDNGRHEHP